MVDGGIGSLDNQDLEYSNHIFGLVGFFLLNQYPKISTPKYYQYRMCKDLMLRRLLSLTPRGGVFLQFQFIPKHIIHLIFLDDLGIVFTYVLKIKMTIVVLDILDTCSN